MFIDVEASSLGFDSFPTEIAWVGESGAAESYLIRPEPGWDDWSSLSEAVTGISREMLARDGLPASIVATRTAAALLSPGVVCVSDAPGYDLRWINRLLAAGGISRDVDVGYVTEAYVEACRPIQRRLNPSQGEWAATVRRVVGAAEEAEARQPKVSHRALTDARALWRTWRRVVDLVAGDHEG